MSRSLSFRNLARAIRIACYCEENNISTSEGLERAAGIQPHTAAWRASRREFLANTGKLALVGAAGWVASPLRLGLASPRQGPDVRVAIVGTGLAGLACGDELNMKGIKADLYDANNRVGGRCFSLDGFFPGQVAERGGEFIDNLHKTLLGYAKRFKLELEDVEKEPPGEVFYYFNGQHFPESAVVEEFRDLVSAMRDDLRTVGRPTADSHTDADASLDFTNLRQYLETRGAGTIVSKAIEQAYVAEFGLEIDQQSCLSFLLFIHADRRSKFRPFGIFSDERYHVVGGNEQIVNGLRDRLEGQIQLGMRLVRARKNARGEIELAFDERVEDREQDVRRCCFCHPVLDAARGRAGCESRAPCLEALRDQRAPLRNQCQDDDRLRRPSVAVSGEQRRVLLGPSASPNDVGDKPHQCHGSAGGANGLLGWQPGCQPRSATGADGGAALPE